MVCAVLLIHAPFPLADLSSHEDRYAFVELLRGLFEYDPTKRLSAHQALSHRFFVGKVRSSISIARASVCCLL